MQLPLSSCARKLQHLCAVLLKGRRSVPISESEPDGMERGTSELSMYEQGTSEEVLMYLPALLRYHRQSKHSPSFITNR